MIILYIFLICLLKFLECILLIILTYKCILFYIVYKKTQYINETNNIIYILFKLYLYIVFKIYFI